MKHLTSATAAAVKPLLNRVKRLMKMKTHPERRSDCLLGAIVLLILSAFPLSALFWGTAGAPQNASAQFGPIPVEKKEKQTIQMYETRFFEGFDPESLKTFLESYLKSFSGDSPAPVILTSNTPQNVRFFVVLGTVDQHYALSMLIQQLAEKQEEMSRDRMLPRPVDGVVVPDTTTSPAAAAAYSPLRYAQSVEPVTPDEIPDDARQVYERIPEEKTPETDNPPLSSYVVPQPSSTLPSPTPLPQYSPAAAALKTIAIRFTQEDPKEFYHLFCFFSNTFKNPSDLATIQFDESSGILIVTGDDSFRDWIRKTAGNYDSKITLHHDTLEKFSLQAKGQVNTQSFILKHCSASKICHFLRSACMHGIERKTRQVGQEIIWENVLDGPVTCFADERTNRLTVAMSYSEDGDAIAVADQQSFFKFINEFIAQCDKPDSGIAPKETPSEEHEFKNAERIPQIETRDVPLSSTPQHAQTPPRQVVESVTMEDGDSAREFAELIMLAFDMDSSQVFHEPPSNKILFAGMPDSIKQLKNTAKGYNQKETTYPYLSFEDYLDQNRSAKTITLKLKHRSGKPLCRFFRAIFEMEREKGNAFAPYVFLDELRGQLILTGSKEVDFSDEDGIREFLDRYDRPEATQSENGKPVEAKAYFGSTRDLAPSLEQESEAPHEE